MRKIYGAIIISIIICITILFLSIVFSDTLEKGLDLGTSILGSFTTVVGLSIAIILFDKFGLDKKIIDYKTAAVFRLIESIRNTQCTINGKNLTCFIPFAVDLESRKDVIKKEGDEEKPLLFRRAIGSEIPINTHNLRNDLWLPTSIKEKLKFLDFFATANKVPQKQLHESLKVNFGTGQDYEYLLIDESNIIKFINDIEGLKSEIATWLKKYSSIDFEINYK